MGLIEVRGKSTKGLRKVYILLNQDMMNGLDYLLRHRHDEKIEVPEKNTYMFSRTTDSPLDGCKAVRDVTNACPGLQCPKSIRTRLLRKYLATTLQVNNMG